MKTKPPAKPMVKERVVSPRTEDGKRPRLKPPALNIDEVVHDEEAPIINPGPEGTEAIQTDRASEGSVDERRSDR